MYKVPVRFVKVCMITVGCVDTLVKYFFFFQKLKRNGNKEVSVTICARCARIIGHSDENFSKGIKSILYEVDVIG